MFKPYAEILRDPAARAFVLAGFVARIPMAMVGLGIVLLVRSTTGSYGLAGAVSATFAIANAIGAPQVGRLVDRFGQHRVLPRVIAVHALGIVALLLAAGLHAPDALLFVPAFVAGLGYPVIGSLVRARWTHRLHGGEQLQTAYALESVIDEVVFTLGPVLVTVLATAVAPVAGLLAATVSVTVGGAALAAQRTTEPPHAGRHAGGPSAMRVPGMAVIASMLVGVGALFGTIDVSMVAFASEHGHAALSGPLLALFAATSGVGGIAYGARTWSLPLHRRLLVVLALMFAGTIPVALVDSLGLMALAVAAAGVSVAPMLITSAGLIEELVPRSALTEGFAWLSTSIGAGSAVGLAAAGHVVDAASGHRAFVVATVASLFSLVVATAGNRWLAVKGERATAAAEG
ncbi:MAG TPA: MFS transporter [Conexibacter sp.]